MYGVGAIGFKIHFDKNDNDLEMVLSLSNCMFSSISLSVNHFTGNYVLQNLPLQYNLQYNNCYKKEEVKLNIRIKIVFEPLNHTGMICS